MPIFTGSFAATKRGKQVGPVVALRELGAILPVSIGVHSAFPQSAFVPGLALIDTGASHTAICVDTARDTLRLRPQSAGQRIVTGAGAFKVDVYACRILVPALAYERDVDEVYGLPLKDSQLLVLVGRDILEEWHVVYNGAQGSVTVCT